MTAIPRVGSAVLAERCSVLEACICKDSAMCRHPLGVQGPVVLLLGRA